MNNLLPNHIKQGQLVGLTIGVSGEIFIKLHILNELNNLSEEVLCQIDTGFNGYVQLSELVINKLQLNIINKSKTKGFDGIEKEVGIVTTKVKLGQMEISNFHIQVVENGLFLIGTKLLLDLKQMFLVDYRNGRVTLTGDAKVQKKVNKAVDRYAK